MSAGEMAALLKQVAYWRDLAQDRHEVNAALTRDVVELREDRRRHHDQKLIGPPPGMPPTASRDRANCVRLTDENERLRVENEDLRRANARLAVEVARYENEAAKGNPT